MKKKYIIEIADDRNIIRNCGKTTLAVSIAIGKTAGSINTGIELTPYTEPDLEQVRKEAYDKGFDDGRNKCSSREYCMNESYQQGLNDAWEAARKIALDKDDGGLDTAAYCEIFGYGKGFSTVLKTFSASEAIEKIRQYEQEQDRQARIEYNFDEIKDVLSTTMKECNVSLDDIAEVLAKMKESDNG